MACWGRHKQREKGESWRKEGGTVRREGELREEGASWEGSENLFHPHFRSSGRIRTYCFFLYIYTSCFELFTPVFWLFVDPSYLLEGCWHIAPFWNVLNMDPLLFLFLSERSCFSFLFYFTRTHLINVYGMGWDSTTLFSLFHFSCLCFLLHVLCFLHHLLYLVCFFFRLWISLLDCPSGSRSFWESSGWSFSCNCERN